MTNETKQLLHLTWLGFGLIMCIGFGIFSLAFEQWWGVAINALIGVYTAVRIRQLTSKEQPEKESEG